MPVHQFIFALPRRITPGIGFESPSLKIRDDERFTMVEPQDALQHLRRNICADSNGIVTECFVHWSLESHDHLHPLFI